MSNIISISKMQEKKKGLGEDSDPILLQMDHLTITGVFDGMGGAGGAECISDYGESHTKAYVGSRIIRDTVEKHIKTNPSLAFNPDFDESLVEVIKECYQAEKEKYPPVSKGGLRSALIKEYPTTLAMTCVREEGKSYVIDSYWAGDSRNYIWTAKGLFQITTDDVKGNIDPLQNLHEDAPMSNCVQADAPFTIHHKVIEGFSDYDQFVIISATDGCFGYYPSPMDFEKILIDSLKYSDNADKWNKKLSQAFEYVTADDFSYSIAAFGFRNFKELKKTLNGNSSLTKYFNKRKSYEDDVRRKMKLEESISKQKAILEEEIKGLWSKYKESYLKYMK